MLGDNLRKFVDYFVEYIKKSEAVETKNVGIELGSVFSEKFKKASTPEEVSALMLEANKYAIATGNPQLAGMFQNLGQIKTMELQQLEKSENEKIIADVSGTAKDTMILFEGKYQKLGETSLWKGIEDLPDRIKPIAINNLVKQYETDVIRTPTYDDKTGQFGLTIGVYTKSDPSNLKITQRLLSYKDKFYEEDETPGYQGKEKLIGEPPEVTKMRTEINLRKKELEAHRSAYNSFSAPFEGIDLEGNKRMVTFNPRENALYYVGGKKLSEQETANINKYYVSQGKESYEGTETQYLTGLSKYEQAIEEEQKNLLSAIKGGLMGKVDPNSRDALSILYEVPLTNAPGFFLGINKDMWEKIYDTVDPLTIEGMNKIKSKLSSLRYQKELFEKKRKEFLSKKTPTAGSPGIFNINWGDSTKTKPK